MLLNLAATPGLGSLLAKRFVAGAGQLALALLGFGLVCVWFVRLYTSLYQQFQENTDFHWHPLPGLLGAALFAAAWLWSLVTSLSIRREARASVSSEAPPRPSK